MIRNFEKSFKMQKFEIKSWKKSLLFKIKVMIFRNRKRFPLTPTIFGLLIQLLAFGMLTIPKFIVISTALIHTPFVFVIGMLIELLVIITLDFVLSRNMKGIK